MRLFGKTRTEEERGKGKGKNVQNLGRRGVRNPLQGLTTVEEEKKIPGNATGIAERKKRKKRDPPTSEHSGGGEKEGEENGRWSRSVYCNEGKGQSWKKLEEWEKGR